MSLRRTLIRAVAMVDVLLLLGCLSAAQTPSPMLLVLEKADNILAFVDPATSQIIGRIPAGGDPHEIIASPDGKLAYISNYGGSDSTKNTISVIDLATRKVLAPINLGALHSAHGLTIAGGKLYFTAETNKIVGRIDPATQTVEWVLGTGEDRTHMVEVSRDLNLIVTSNVGSGTLSLIDQVTPTMPGPPPGAAAGAPPPGTPPGGPRKTWRVTNVPAGRGAEGFDISPDGNEIWAANAGDGTVTVVDVASKKVKHTFPVAVRGNRLKFTPDGRNVLISGAPGSAAGPNVVVLDASTHKEVKQLNMGGGSSGILMIPDGSRAYVAVSSKDKITVVDLKTFTVSAEIATGKNPDGLAWAQTK